MSLFPFLMVLVAQCALTIAVSVHDGSVFHFGRGVEGDGLSALNTSITLDASGQAVSVNRQVLVGYQIYTQESLEGLDLPSSCKAALSGRIRCDEYTQSFQTLRYRGPLNTTLADAVCDVGCGLSLSNWFRSVTATCAGNKIDGAPATKVGGFIWAGYNETCLKDQASKQYCNGERLESFKSLL